MRKGKGKGEEEEPSPGPLEWRDGAARESFSTPTRDGRAAIRIRIGLAFASTAAFGGTTHTLGLGLAGAGARLGWAGPG